MIFKKKKENIKGPNYLDLTPQRLLKEIKTEDGLVSVLIPKFTNKFAVKYITPRLKSPDIKLKLDEIGSEVWLRIDGKKNVRSICDELEQKFGEKIHPVHERLTKFLTQLYLQKFISFIELKSKGD